MVGLVLYRDVVTVVVPSCFGVNISTMRKISSCLALCLGVLGEEGADKAEVE